MSDWVDDASEITEKATEAAIAAARRKAGVRPLVPKGVCYFCDQETTPVQLFCDADCSSMWEKQRRPSHIIAE